MCHAPEASIVCNLVTPDPRLETIRDKGGVLREIGVSRSGLLRTLGCRATTVQYSTSSVLLLVWKVPPMMDYCSMEVLVGAKALGSRRRMAFVTCTQGFFVQGTCFRGPAYSNNNAWPVDRPGLPSAVFFPGCGVCHSGLLARTRADGFNCY